MVYCASTATYTKGNNNLINNILQYEGVKQRGTLQRFDYESNIRNIAQITKCDILIIKLNNRLHATR